MVIKASRRDMFRGMFSRAGFELPIDTAHEILMRLNALTDPIPVSVPMWDAYLAARRPLRFTDFARSRSGDRGEILEEVDQASAHADFAGFEDDIARDLRMLLRVEILLRMRAAAGTGEPDAPAPDGEPTTGPGRRRIIESLVNEELASYLRRQHIADAVAQPRVDEVAGYLLNQVRQYAAQTRDA